jgi:hypothetical protein
MCSVVTGSWLRLLNQNLVICSMFLVGRLTCKSFMSSVIILLCSLIWILCRSCATSFEFCAVYVFGKSIKRRSFLLRNLASLYDGACLLFITGQMGSPSLCFFYML